MMAEASSHELNCVLTLTYDDEHLDKDLSLVPSDIRNFFKRLRKAGRKFRYYQCGEYGSKKQRPHHHVAVFGQDWHRTRVPWAPTPKGNPQWRDERLEEQWGNGIVSIGHLDASSAAYVAQYVTKKAQQCNDPEGVAYRRTDPISGDTWQVHPEYATMSRRPGLGEAYFHANYRKIYELDQVALGGTPVPVPKYYDRLLKEVDPDLARGVFAKRRREHLERMQAEHPPEQHVPRMHGARYPEDDRRMFAREFNSQQSLKRHQETQEL